MKIVFWSGTGNTEAMAEAIGKGIKENGKDVEILRVDEVNIGELLKDDILTLGCPAMGDEVLEEGEFEPFIESISSKISGKKVNLFGSYGWGDGQWMRGYGCIITEEPLIFQNEADEEECVKFGKKIALL